MIITFSSVSILFACAEACVPSQWIWVIGTAITAVKTMIAANSLASVARVNARHSIPCPGAGRVRIERPSRKRY